jgi:hypothetical protein
MRLQGSLHPGWRSAPSLSAYSGQSRQIELSNASHWICGRPRREVLRRNSNELCELPRH